jgi:hypothetical protein
MMTAACRHSRSEDARDAAQGDDWIVVFDRVEMQSGRDMGKCEKSEGRRTAWVGVRRRAVMLGFREHGTEGESAEGGTRRCWKPCMVGW